MNQQNQGSGSSNPTKRKRGRPRKDESTAQPQADNTPVRHDNVINSSQTQGTTGDAGDGMLGRAVIGVIEGVFGAGYLLNVRVGDSQTYLKGAVFLPGRYAPVTPENDVAPHLEMIQRKQFPIPVLNQQPHMQSVIPSSPQVSQQPIVSAEPEAVLSDQIHDEPKNSNVELNMAVSAELEAVQSDQIHDKPENPNIELNQMPVLEPMQSEQTHDEPKNTDIELNQMPVSAEHKAMQSDLIHEEPENLNIEINQMPIAAEPSMQSEQIHDELKNSTVELNQVPMSAQEAMQSVDIFVDQQDSPKPALETRHPSTLFEGELGPSESKFASEGSNLQEMSAP